MRRPVALTIAGSDPLGAAGLQADLKVFAAHGVWGSAAVAALTSQSHAKVLAAEAVSPEALAMQVATVLSSLPPAAAKTGMLATATNVGVVAEAFADRAFPLVVDPVLAASDGTPLMERAGLGAYRSRLLPLAALATPNLSEAAALSGLAVATRAQMEAAGEALLQTGCPAVLVTGGHLVGPVVADVLVTAAGVTWWETGRVAGSARGTGCALSAAITANLALGQALPAAIAAAREWLSAALANGRGMGPALLLDHSARPDA